ncbi:hypothetical protein LCGC14_1381740 [marine sediment metagenome]|uniref:Terminase large subunit gp17-like C-terminal domain-containing protein n=1 Tax=marine sediment metagenome TaxID=412755 RepID=A0A0F9K2L4_9ZZZZ
MSKMGRPRIHANGAAKQKAYRERKKKVDQLHTLSKAVQITNNQIIARRQEGIGEQYISPLGHTEWAKYYMGLEWKTDYLEKLGQYLWEHFRIIAFLPRTSGKSLKFVSLGARYILERQVPLLTLASGPASKVRLFDAIRRVVTSEKIVNDYGEMFNSFDGNKCTIKLEPELRGIYIDPVLRVAGRGDDVIGSHPRWLHLEDIIQEEFKADESNESLIDWYEGVVSYMASHEKGYETRITGTATRKSKKDFYYHLIEKLKYQHFTMKALTLVSGDYPNIDDLSYLDNGKIEIDMAKGTYEHIGIPSWPLSRLLINKILQPMHFRTNMQNEPVDPEGNWFERKHWTEVEWKQDVHSQFVISIDPAFGKSKSADNTAIIVMTKSGFKQYVIVEVYADKVTSLAKILLSIWQRYPNTLRVVCESNYLQKIFVVDQLNKKLPFVISPFYSKGDKIMRIQSLNDPFAGRTLTVWKNCIGKDGLFDEYISFIPKESTAGRKDDRLDATHMGYETWIRMESSSRPSDSFRTSSQFEQPFTQ